MTITELRELLAKATPGPIHMTKLQEGADIRARSDWIATYGEERDAALIVAAINALPALLEVAELLREARDYVGDGSFASRRVVDMTNMKGRIDAALAKLEATK